MVLTSSIGMELSKEDSYGKTLGLIGSVSTAAAVVGYFIVMVGFKFLNFSFKTAYLIAAAMYILAAIFLLPIKMPNVRNHKGLKFVIKKITGSTMFFLSSLVQESKFLLHLLLGC